MASPDPPPLVDDPPPSVAGRVGSRTTVRSDTPAAGRSGRPKVTAPRPEPVRARANGPVTDVHGPTTEPVAAAVTEPEPDVEFWGEERKPKARKTLPNAAGETAVVPVTPSPEGLADRGDEQAVGRLKARKVRRILRHISPWSVFKVALLFYVCLWLILMVASVILWRIAQDVGVVTNVEDFYAELMGKEFYEFDGRRMFRAAAVIGGILAVASTGFTVLMTVLFNVISDFTGGIRVSVIELEEARRETRRPRTPRATARTGTGE